MVSLDVVLVAAGHSTGTKMVLVRQSSYARSSCTWTSEIGCSRTDLKLVLPIDRCEDLSNLLRLANGRQFVQDQLLLFNDRNLVQ